MIIEEIKARLPINSVINGTVELKNNKGFCPFHHNENTPAFAIFPHTQTWRCFGACNEGGDIFDFYQKLHGLDFPEALRELALQAGVPLDDSPEAKQRIKTEYDKRRLNERVAVHYQENLASHWEAMGYLRRRKLNRAIGSGLVGFANGSLPGYLKEQKLMEIANREDILKSGRDVLDGLVYICRTPHGTAVDFESRSISKKKHRRLGPKHPFWAIRDMNRLIIVEGPADALTWWQFGFSSLALNGLNVRGVDFKEIKKFKTVFYLADNDFAGRDNLDKMADKIGPLTMVCSSPYRLAGANGAKDSNDLLQAGATKRHFEHILQTGRAWIELLIDAANGLTGIDFDEAMARIMSQFGLLPEYSSIRYKEAICRELRISKATFNSYLKITEPDSDETLDLDLLEFRSTKERYMVLRNKTLYLKQDRDGETRPELLIEADLKIDKIIYRYGSEETIDLLISCKNGEDLGRAMVPIDRFSKMNWVTESWPTLGIKAPARLNADYLREAIQVLSSPREAYVYEHLGWSKVDGQRVYLSNSGLLGYQGEKDIAVDISLGRENSNMKLFRLPQSPKNVEEAWRFSLSLWDKLGDVGILMWAAAHAAPMIPLLNPTFLILLYARTNSFKSTIAGIFQAFFGDWGKYGSKDAWKFLPGSFRTTMHGIIKNAYLAKDVLYVVDDFFPREGREMRKMSQILVELIRAAGNQAGRDRMSGSTKFQKYSDRPRCLTIVTAEELPSQMLEESDLARVVGCPLREWHRDDPETEVFMHNLTNIYNRAGELKHSMASFVLFLQKNWDSIKKDLPDIEFANIELFSQSRYPRQPEAFSKLLTAVQVALFAAVECGAITEAEAKQRKEQAGATLNRLMEEYGHHISGIDPVVRFVEALRERLDDDWILAEDQIGSAGIDDIALSIAYGHHHAGYRDDRFVYLKPAYVRKILSDKDNPIAIGLNTLYERLASRGWLIKRNGGATYTEYVRHRKASIRLVHIPKHVIYQES